MNCEHCTGGVVVLFNSRETCRQCHGTGKKKKVVHDARETPLDPEDFGIDLEITEIKDNDDGCQAMEVKNPCMEINIGPPTAEINIEATQTHRMSSADPDVDSKISVEFGLKNAARLPAMRRIHMKPMEYAHMIDVYLKRHPDETYKSLGEKTNQSAGFLMKRHSLLKFHPDIKDDVDAGRISMLNAYLLAKFCHATQLELRVDARNLTNASFLAVVRCLPRCEAKPPESKFDPAQYGRDTGKAFAKLLAEAEEVKTAMEFANPLLGKSFATDQEEFDSKLAQQTALSRCKEAYSTLSAYDVAEVHQKLSEFAQELAE